MQGKIIKILSNQYTVYSPSEGRVMAVAMGKLRLKEKPLVGDEVRCDLIDGKYCMQEVLERKNRLYRPSVANVDQAMVVMSATRPEFSNTLVDRLIFLISYYDIEPLIVITKMDLVKDDDEVYKYIEDYRNSGYQVITLAQGGSLDELKEALKGKVTVLAGQSGVGKSTILNRLDENFALATQDISLALGRGKHTTRHTELYEVADGLLADTPGFSSLDFSYIDGDILAQKIKDFKVEGQCRFNDCRHVNEPDCIIKQGVQNGTISKYRYDSYIEVRALCDQKEKWEK